MTRPPLRTMILGHPLVATLAMLFGLFMLYLCWLGGSGWLIMAVFTAVGMLATLKASERASAYRKWKREWDALAEPGARPRGKSRYVVGMVLASLVILVVIGSGAHAVAMVASWAFGLAAAVGLFTLMRRIGRWFSAAPSRSQAVDPVAIVAKPIMPMPAPRDACDALPDYCQRLISGPGR